MKIDIPFNIGDTVYYIAFGKIYEGECIGVYVTKTATNIMLYDFDGDKASYALNNVFPTKADAENKLKGGKI